MGDALSPADAIAPATRTQALDGDVSFSDPVTLFVGTGGDVVIDGQRDAAGTKTKFANVPDGTFLPVCVKRVYGGADGTTASDIVAVWRP